MEVSEALGGRDGSVRLRVHVQPGSSREGIAGLHGDRLKMRVGEPPEDGRANARVVRLVAEAFRLRVADVTLVAGASSRAKDLILGEITLETARKRLQELLERAPPAVD